MTKNYHCRILYKKFKRTVLKYSTYSKKKKILYLNLAQKKNILMQKN